MARKLEYKPRDLVVYPCHGLGEITGIEVKEFGGVELQLYVISFDKEKMILRVPVDKARPCGMRRVSTRDEMDKALCALRGRARVKRTMWSRRAQEYEAKLNSGNPVSVAEVVRDLHRAADQPEQSYSERQLYEAALDRLSREYAAVESIDQPDAAKRLEDVIKKAA
jgi:CarD family transcriptional regulator